MSQAAAAIAAERPAMRLGLSVRTLTVALLSLFAADNLLLLHFWGLPLAATAGLAFLASSAIWMLSRKIPDALPAVPPNVFAVALLVSLGLFALGGEGRFFYANTDWQVRESVLRDLATNPWPFAYSLGGKAYFLRAPIGTYLLPALFGTHAEIMLLISNALRLTLLLTLGWHLFDGRVQRAIALGICILFSGWDAVGTALYSALGANLTWDHIEPWNFGFEYSSNVTLAFWAPQHAIAGWTCALAFMLWRKGLVPLGAFAASIPLVAIWSPLAVMGAIPFAVFAGVSALRRKAFDLNDVGLGALAVALALPALVYLQIDAVSVGTHWFAIHPLVWVACIVFEVLPFTVPLLRKPASSDKPLVLLILTVLMAMPLVQIGEYSDFQMRASIMPLALLSTLFAQWMCRIRQETPVRTAALVYAIIAVALGAATPVLEIKRAVVNAPSPQPLCSLVGVWTKQDMVDVTRATYLAPVSKLPPALRGVPVTAGQFDPARCWDREWALPEGWARRSAG